MSTESVNDYRSLDAFLNRFESVATHFKWYFKDGFKLRCRIDKIECCPLQAYGYIRSANKADDRVVPDTRSISGACNIHDSVAAAVVHLADDMLSSRYYDPGKRARLVALCGLKEEPVADEEDL